jgi:tRNA pseudouridine55 synthase
MFGVLNIYKPCGLTSHDVVNILRKILGIKQIGHTGTLDPFAEGVLPICAGKATRLIDYFDSDKAYEATLQFGEATDTYDREGKITYSSNKKITKPELENELKNFSDEIEQVPPIYSAIKINGKKLYEYARCGNSVDIPSRKVTIFEIELKDFNENKQTAVISVKCSKGTYIRSLANDIGQNLGCYAHLTKLVRTASGKFTVENSTKLPVKILSDNENNNHSKKYEIEEDAKEGILNAIENPINVLSLMKINISEKELEKIKHGNPIKKDLDKIYSGDFFILVYNNNVVAVAQYDGVELKVKKVFI